jgi:hypothetical protein
MKLTRSEDDYEKIIELLRSNDFKNQREDPSLEEYWQIYSDMFDAAFPRICIA